jgi:hypothetical protein
MSGSRIEEIQVVVDSDGKVTIKVTGMEGDTCLKATEALEALLGDVEQRERTTTEGSGEGEKKRVKT